MSPARLVPLDSYVELPLEEMRRETEGLMAAVRRAGTAE